MNSNRAYLWSSAALVVISVASVSCGSRGGTESPSSSHSTSTASAGTVGNAGAVSVSYADVVDRVAPAVVTIRSARKIRVSQQFPFSDDPLLGNLFRGTPHGSPPLIQRALGSGVLVTADGYIVTNHHVIDGADQITVELNERKTYQAKLTGSDPPSDLAVLKIDANRLPLLPLGDSDKVRVGDVCLAIGNPLGIGETVTAGIISAKGRSTGLSDGNFEDFLQTDAAINQGNSGGALVSTGGELIGINSQILSPSGGNIGIGFAIPSNMTRNVMEQLRRDGKVRRGVLGVGVQMITRELAAALNLKEERGVLINSVAPGSPAERAGLKSGDIITALNGTAVNDPNTLRNMIANTAPGTDVTLTILRDGREQQVHARLSPLSAGNEDTRAAPNTRGSGAPGQLGLTVEPLTPELAKEMGLRPGTQGVVVAEVDPSGPAAEAGIRPLDVILEVNRGPVRSPTDIRAALARSGSHPALLLVNRSGRNLFLTVQPNAG